MSSHRSKEIDHHAVCREPQQVTPLSVHEPSISETGTVLRAGRVNPLATALQSDAMRSAAWVTAVDRHAPQAASCPAPVDDVLRNRASSVSRPGVTSSNVPAPTADGLAPATAASLGPRTHRIAQLQQADQAMRKADTANAKVAGILCHGVAQVAGGRRPCLRGQCGCSTLRSCIQNSQCHCCEG